MARRKSVIVFNADQQRADSLGCTGTALAAAAEPPRPLVTTDW